MVLCLDCVLRVVECFEMFNSCVKNLQSDVEHLSCLMLKCTKKVAPQRVLDSIKCLTFAMCEWCISLISYRGVGVGFGIFLVSGLHRLGRKILNL